MTFPSLPEKAVSFLLKAGFGVKLATHGSFERIRTKLRIRIRLPIRYAIEGASMMKDHLV